MPRNAKPNLSQREREVMRASVPYALPEGDEPVPQDRDVFRYGLIRKVLSATGMPRRCREPACRRRKLCVGLTLRCQRDCPPPQSSPEDDARFRAELLRAIKRRQAELDAAKQA